MAVSEREGQRLGNYRLQRLLGKGSLAEVYLGEHLYLRTYAAIKILRNSLDEKEEQLFLSEARTIANLTHPHIIRVHEFAIERSTPFLVMDYTPAGTLRQRYPLGTCLSLEETVKYVKEIASALQHAHNQDLIHRDVKPENILQGTTHVLLSDFGISIHTPKSTAMATQAWAGTLLYMAPEQFQGQAVFASDQYSLAILAYEWLCGVCPFTGSPTGLAYQHGHVAPPRLREKDPSLPEEVEAVILKALAKDPEERYPSVLTFARALESAYHSVSHSPGTTTIGEETRRDLVGQPVTQCVFLSSVAQDDVTSLHMALSSRGILVREDTEPEPQEEKLRQAIRAAQMVVLVLTPHVRSSAAVKEHLRIAALYKRPISCLWVQGEDLQQLLPVGAEQATILDARGPRYGQALDEITSFLERQASGASVVEPPRPDLDFEPRNPYKGLRAFSQQDRADFFGREALIKELFSQLNKVGKITSAGEFTPRLLAVIGPSGSGKSSVVMAGLLPRLQEDAVSGSAAWRYLDPMVPGKQPLEALVHLLAERLPDKDLQAIREVLTSKGALGLHQLGLALVEPSQAQVVLTIDQFEEVFSSDVSESERQRFLDLLVTAATEPRGPVLVLLTMRAFTTGPLPIPPSLVYFSSSNAMCSR